MSFLFSIPKSAFSDIFEKLANHATKLSQERYTPQPFDARQYEVHKSAIDVQFLESGFEDIYIIDAKKLVHPLDFDAEKDIGFYRDRTEPDACIHLKKGLFCVIFPGEAHIPCLCPNNETSPNPVEKCVAKIAIETYQKNPLIFTQIFEH